MSPIPSNNNNSYNQDNDPAVVTNEKKCQCFSKIRQLFTKKKDMTIREIPLGLSNTEGKKQKFPPNYISNQKYNILTFIPLILFNQFKMFLNICFLIMALSQFYPPFMVGSIYTYWGPLLFVLAVTIIREAIDDIRRWKRDKEVNESKYSKLTETGQKVITSAEIKVGDLIVVEKNQRLPADMVLLRTTEKNGACFIRTDQLDGETDWKLRLALPTFQGLKTDFDIFKIRGTVTAEAPRKDIYNFEGAFHGTQDEMESVSIDNMLWSNTILANGTAVCIVTYTGRQTRSAMNNSSPRTKLGCIDYEVNNLAKLLIFSVVLLSILMMIFKGFSGQWYRYLWRFFLLFSYIIPLALVVNLDMSKLSQSFKIMRDPTIPGNMVRTTTIPEELGRISYLLSDKTGTLTQNEMIFKKLHLGPVSFTHDTMDEIIKYVETFFSPMGGLGFSLTARGSRKSGKGESVKKRGLNSNNSGSMGQGNSKVRKTTEMRVGDALLTVAICHNVTPMYDDDDGGGQNGHNSDNGRRNMPEIGEENIVMEQSQSKVTYQASSPDEISLVSWCETIGLTLTKRDLYTMTLTTPQGHEIQLKILHLFPFTSDTKRMGIIVRNERTREITFYMKGADVVMTKIVNYADWLDEETGNMAREGLRTLVFGKRVLTQDQFESFDKLYKEAKCAMSDRSEKVTRAIATIENNMELVGLTGVEDKLQEDVRPTLETLRNAGIKVWMLTGDKLETAMCIAKSTRLVHRSQRLHVFGDPTNRDECHRAINNFRKKEDSALVITGNALEETLKHYEIEFFKLACEARAVVVCRCSPTQKAVIVELVKKYTNCSCAAIGDGGNDVSMIQAANVGIGIQGKEGKQASMASDFSLLQFSHIAPLLLVHGRNCYKNTATLSQFIIHRGITISVMQAIYSACFYFISIQLFPSILMVGYATIFTMFPVFSLILDKDVNDDTAIKFPELYKVLQKGRELNFKTFFVWVLISLYQGGIIMYGSLVLFQDDFIHVVSITFTSLVLTELLMVALTIHTWHMLMIVSEIVSVLLYLISLIFFKQYFDMEFLTTIGFVWRTALVTGLSCVPLCILKFIRFKLRPPIYSKLQQ